MKSAELKLSTYGCRRILRISCAHRVINEGLLPGLKNCVGFRNNIKTRKLGCRGYIVSKKRDRSLQVLIQGRGQGKTSIKRRRTSSLRNLRELYDCSSTELWYILVQTAASRVRIVMMIAESLGGDNTSKRS